MQNYYGSSLRFFKVRLRPGTRTRGLLHADGRIFQCALGRSGIGHKRGEGDGITPRGRFQLLSGLVRTDRIAMRHGRLALHRIGRGDGWCDEQGDRNYNCPVGLPYRASHEQLWRQDHLYDVALVMDFNIRQHLGVGGSAIFFHIAHEDYRPTEGCVAVSRTDMLWLLPRIGTRTVMIVD